MGTEERLSQPSGPEDFTGLGFLPPEIVLAAARVASERPATTAKDIVAMWTEAGYRLATAESMDEATGPSH